MKKFLFRGTLMRHWRKGYLRSCVGPEHSLTLQFPLNFLTGKQRDTKKNRFTLSAISTQRYLLILFSQIRFHLMHMKTFHRNIIWIVSNNLSIPLMLTALYKADPQ